MNNMKLKPYPKYKDSGIQWIGEIPEGWEVHKLKYKTIINKKKLEDDVNPNYVINYLDISNVDSDGNILDIEEQIFEDAPSRARRIPGSGDTILSTARTYLKAIAYLENIPDNLIVSTGFAVLEPIKPINSKYFFYSTSSEVFIQNVIAYSKGVAYPAINPPELGQILIIIPSLPEQTTIANFLDKQNAKIDVLIAKDKKLIELLKEKRTALINHAVTEGLDPNVKLKDSRVDWIGEIPEGWEVVPLKKYLETFVDYRGATPEKTDEGIFLVTGKNIKGGKIDYELSKEYVFEDQYEEVMHRGKPKIGDLLFTTEAPLGEVANVDYEKIALAQRIIKIRGKKQKLDNYYLKYYIMTQLFQSHLQSLATGSTALGLKASNWCFLKLIVPPHSEQLQIVQYLDKATAKIDKTIQKIEEKITLLEENKKSLIHHVVTGKVDVRKSEV
jgi:type I restriction enzyme S subunit